MFTFSKDFPQAIKDYETFLWKQYPQKAVLKLAGDRYKLTGTERAMLYRGVTTFDKAVRRRSKLTNLNALKGEVLHIDAFNQLLTISSYLHGKPVFISFDGCLRDASEIHGKSISPLLPMRAVEIIISFLLTTGIEGAKLIFDTQINGHELFMEKLNKALPDFKLNPELVSSENTDSELIKLTKGIICTSDSVIIERTPLKVFDLARSTLEYHFWPKFIDMNNLAADTQI
jgi:hypothetical protein